MKFRNRTTYQEYVDRGVSGAKKSRPALDKLMKDAIKRKFDILLVWKFDRFARSTKHPVAALEELEGLGIDFCSYEYSIDTSTNHGKLVFTIMGAIAEFERSLIRERVLAGIRTARGKGIMLKTHTTFFRTIGYLTSHTKLLTALRSGAQGNIHLEDLCSRHCA